MNRQHRTWTILCFLTLFLAVTGAGEANDKVRIAVVDFDTEAVHATWHWGWH